MDSRARMRNDPTGMSEAPGKDERELRRLRSEVAAQHRDIHAMDDREHRQETLIVRLSEEAAVREGDLAVLRERLEAAELELEDLRAIRDALTPPELPQRPGLELAAAFLPAAATHGDFTCAEGPRSTAVVASRRPRFAGGAAAAFVRTAFAATAPFSDDPCRLLSWANTALIERAGISSEFVTAACVTYLPNEQLLRWAYAGHPSALWIDDGGELVTSSQAIPLGVRADLRCDEGSRRSTAGAGVLLYTDGLTEARHDGKLFGLDGVSAALGGLRQALTDRGGRRPARTRRRLRLRHSDRRPLPARRPHRLTGRP